MVMKRSHMANGEVGTVLSNWLEISQSSCELKGLWVVNMSQERLLLPLQHCCVGFLLHHYKLPSVSLVKPAYLSCRSVCKRSQAGLTGLKPRGVRYSESSRWNLRLSFASFYSLGCMPWLLVYFCHLQRQP